MSLASASWVAAATRPLAWLRNICAASERARLVWSKHQRAQIIALHQLVSFARQCDNRHAYLAQGGHIAVDRSLADLEDRRKILRADTASMLQLQQNAKQAVNTIHDLPGCR